MPASKINIITHEFYPRKGGISVYIQEIARCACELGYPVEVWAPAHTQIAEANFPFAVKGLALKGSQGWISRIRLAREICKSSEKLEGSILYLPEPGPIRTLMYLNRVKPLGYNRLVITLHGSEILRLSAPPHRKYLFGKLLDEADKIGVVSRYTQSLLFSKFPKVKEKTVVTPGAIRADFKNLKFIPREPSGKIIVLTVARVHPRKGQLEILRGMARLPQSLRDKIEYIVVGPEVNPSYFQKMENFAKKHNLNFRYLGELEDSRLGDAYQRADLFAMTSLPQSKSVEGYGLAYIEAAAHGLPVIANRTGGAPEAMLDGKTGILVEPCNTETLANALTRLADDPQLREKMGREGRQWANQLSWESNVRQLFGNPA